MMPRDDIPSWGDRDLRETVFNGLLDAMIEREFERDPWASPSELERRARQRMIGTENGKTDRPLFN